MNRYLISVGLSLVDAEVRPDVARWIVNLLGTVPRAYLPHPRVRRIRRATVLHFSVADRDLIFAVVEPGFACWARLHPDGSQDRDHLGANPAERLQPLFDWLMDNAALRV